MLALAVSLTQAWAALYTRGLPKTLRNRRREEIDCDLWEHQRLADLERAPATGTAVEILLRLVLGLPADVIWRLETGASARSERNLRMNDTPMMRGLLAVALIVAISPVGLGIAVLAGNGELSSTERLMFGAVWILAGLAMITGLFLSTARPRLGLALAATGTVIIAVGMFWIFFITIPLGAGIIYLAYRRGKPDGWGWPGNARPA